ncbi:MAG: PLP-dependent aminotransferase family protein [Myxococcales bacterium]|nr:PLP-dependent aminotransferase family protein [Myxococcales bacterium]
MARWTLQVALDDDPQPLTTRIAQAIVQDVRRGRLRPGDVLPGSRTLAASLGVHRNTVLAAFDALRAEGWIEADSARETRVATSLPETRAKRFSGRASPRASLPEQPGFALGPQPPSRDREDYPGTIALFGGQPDLGLFPVEAYARAHRRALRTQRKTLLDYGSPRGHAALRRAVAEMLSSLRAVAAREENVLVTRGSQQALDLISRALIAPGDVVAVEAMGYSPSWQALRAAGAKLEPIAVDASGLDVDALAAVCERARVRAVYVTPHHQYPTTVTLSAGRRMALLALAKRHSFAIIEDDYDHEFHYEGRPVLPLASADPDGHVVYIATLSKMLAPGLRVGFVVASRAVIEALARWRVYADRQGDMVMEAALAELIEDGELARHARRARLAYLERRDVFVEALRRELGGALAFEVPRGGLALWARLEARGADGFCERALSNGVLVQRTRTMVFDGGDRPWVRLGFAGNDGARLEEAAKRLRGAMRDAKPSKAR